ncbi:MAG: DsbE family thiol:disulfide interchange protein [Pseudomonadales bacterium]|nr:DsbE family thiol:disulfide interchange protein [Pseudomonadales bacterium]
MSRASLFIPLGIFAAIVVIGYAGFSLNDPHALPSALLGKPFPEFTAPRLDTPRVQVDRQALLGSPVLVNVWATWCPTCKAEHEELVRIRRETGLRIVGINYKDNRQAALRWLAEFGDPYEFVIQDLDGSLGVELGVYGAPESFLVDASGVIVYKRVGEINPRIWQDELLPRLRTLEAPGLEITGVAGRSHEGD